MEKSIHTGSVGSSVLSGARTKSKKSSKRSKRYHTMSKQDKVTNHHVDIQSKAHDLQLSYFDPLSKKKVDRCIKQYDKERDNVKRCKYHQ
mmetsp:Transcript_22423/g.34685  ORF Transcript_22423/g.34685 Transcript_22423/m.34685 type:complete len:90 (+) Transcript_22423:1388-1657(+)